jgi:hypothetical protein
MNPASPRGVIEDVRVVSDVSHTEGRLMSGKKPMLRWRWLALAVILLGIGAAWMRTAFDSESLVPVGQSIRFDDFTFAVEGSRYATLGAGSKAKRYLVVRLKVVNQAMVVKYTFRPQIAILVADNGRERGISNEGQLSLDLSRGGPDALASPLPPGASGTTELVFDLPEAATNPRIKISHGGPILDVVDDLVGGKRRLKIQ